MKKICPQGHYYSGRECNQCKRSRRRHYDHAWNKLSARYRKLNPLCEDCDKEGRTTPCTEVHHIVPITQDPSLRLVWSNLVALCHECHDKRHGKQSSKYL